jgi:Icc-related predicted phosphoesterase
LEKFSPRYFIHGHIHMNYQRNVRRVSTYQDTTVVNAYERYIIEL